MSKKMFDPEEDPPDALHKVVVVFTIDSRKIVSHRDTGKKFNPCPEPEKGIQGYDNFYIVDYEVSDGKKLPRRTWFGVIKITCIQPLELSPRVFTPWNPSHKIHPSPLRSNFIDIVDNLDLEELKTKCPFSKTK